MAEKTAQQIKEKFQRNLSASAPDYAAGVKAPSRDWAEATAAARPRWENGIQQAIANGAFAAGVQRAGSGKWQNRSATIGAQRFAQSAPEAAEAYGKVAGDIMEAARAARQAANAMPNTTFEERLQRSNAANRAVHELWQQKKLGRV